MYIDANVVTSQRHIFVKWGALSLHLGHGKGVLLAFSSNAATYKVSAL